MLTIILRIYFFSFFFSSILPNKIREKERKNTKIFLPFYLFIYFIHLVHVYHRMKKNDVKMDCRLQKKEEENEIVDIEN